MMPIVVTIMLHILRTFCDCQNEVILIKTYPGCSPFRVCEANGLDDVVANTENLSFLISMLNNNCIEAATVGGWEDHIDYNMVLRSNGALAPFNPVTNDACYAFCVSRGKGYNRKHCPPKHCPPKPCPPPRPHPCPPAPCPPRPCPPPRPHPCPPEPCYEYSSSEKWHCPPEDHRQYYREEPVARQRCPPKSKHCPEVLKCYKEKKCDDIVLKCTRVPRKSCSSSSSRSRTCSRSRSCSSSSSRSCHRRSCSSSSSSRSRSDHRRRKCPKYLKRTKYIFKNPAPPRRNEDHLNLTVDRVLVAKTFVFNERDLRSRKARLIAITDSKSNKIDWVELQKHVDFKAAERSQFPAALRNPLRLFKLRKHLARRCREPNPCLYVDCQNNLYVRICNELFFICFERKYCHKTRFDWRRFTLIPVRGRRLSCLIQKGLFGIAFECDIC